MAPDAGAFVHAALFYESDHAYLAGLLPFLTQAVEDAEPVAVAVPGPRLRLLRSALASSAADRITFIDLAQAGRNPGRIIAKVLRHFADAHPGRAVRIVGEPIWAGRDEVEYPACVIHEALINAAFVARNATIVCPYDVSRLALEVVDDARATHPVLWEGERRLVSDAYAPEAVMERHNRPWNEGISSSTQGRAVRIDGKGDLADARDQATRRARALGLSDDRIEDLRIIATELVTNSLRHSSGGCRLLLHAVRRARQRFVVCEVADDGHLADPLAGRRPAVTQQLGGRGLLIVNDLADLVRVHTHSAGTTIAAFLALT